MFAPYCPNHDAQVLLFADNIESIASANGGFDVHYRCTCGYRGVWHPERLAS
jgi:hypothetical protein